MINRLKKSKKIVGFLLFIFVMIINISIVPEMVEGKTIKKSGFYHTAVVKNYSGDYYYYMSENSPVMKKIRIKKNKIITYGSFTFRSNKNNYTSMKYLKKGKRTFKISNKCTFWDGAWTPGGEFKITKKNFYKRVKSILKVNIPCDDLEIQVRKGKVVKMMLGQG